MKKLKLSLFILLSGVLSFSQNLPLIQTDGTHFINNETKASIVLKGINISNDAWGTYIWPISDSLERVGNDPLIRPTEIKDHIFSRIDVQNISSFGGNVVRYNINPELFYENNSQREINISKVKEHIEWLENENIYTIICMQMNPGLDVQNDLFNNKKHDTLRIKSTFEDDSIFTLWKDVWVYLAKNLNDKNSVVGYELLNEPKRPALADASTQDLVNDYVEIINAIRTVDPLHIIFVPEFNSREAEPHEQRWDEQQNAWVLDNGYQGTLWGANWLELPQEIENLAYVAHVYNPYGFTSGESQLTFDPSTLENKVSEAISFVHTKNNKPLYVSEYGVTYFHVLEDNDSIRIKWLNTVHQLFEKNHISSTIWQYKQIVNPWVKVSGTFSAFYHYPLTHDIKEIKDGEIIYATQNAENGAQNSGMYDFLNEHFVSSDTLLDFTVAKNQYFISELIRYFNGPSLNAFQKLKSIDHDIYVTDNNQLIIKGLNNNQLLDVNIYNLNGQLLGNKEVHFNSDSTSIHIPAIQNLSNQTIIISIDNLINQKLFIP